MRDATGRINDTIERAGSAMIDRAPRVSGWDGAVYALTAHCRVSSVRPGRFLPAGVEPAVLGGRAVVRGRRG